MKNFNDWLKNKDTSLYEGIMGDLGSMAGKLFDKAATSGGYSPENVPKQKKKQKKQKKK